MLIDWFTVGAQLLNFLILVWLMKRFLYQPVLQAIAAREQKIAATLADAAAQQAQAQAQQAEFRQKNEALDAQRADLLRQARDAADAEAERLRSEARAEAEAVRAAQSKTLQSDARQLRADITRQVQEQVFDISRKVLAELASASLEQQACEVFLQRLQALEGQALATLGQALKAASEAEPAVLRSAFELPAAQQAALRSALQQRFGQPVALVFEPAPELVSGIALSAQGQQLDWNVAEHLASLAAGLQQRLGVAQPA